jgi:2'-5' RNA ligase
MTQHCVVVLLPAPTPVLPDTAHLTIVYAGEDPTAGVVARLKTLAAVMSIRTDPFSALTFGVNHQFGENHDEPVLLIGLTPELASLNSLFASYSRSEYKEFRPHIAVSDVKRFTSRWRIPRHVYFNKIAVWLGDYEGPAWWLGTDQPVT